MAAPKYNFIENLMPGEIRKIPVVGREPIAAIYTASVASFSQTIRHAKNRGFFGLRYVAHKSRMPHPTEAGRHVLMVYIEAIGDPDEHGRYSIPAEKVRLEKYIRGRPDLRDWPAEEIAAIYSPAPTRLEPVFGAASVLTYRWPDGTEAYYDGDWYMRTLENKDWHAVHNYYSVTDSTGNNSVWPFEPKSQIAEAIPGYHYDWK